MFYCSIFLEISVFKDVMNESSFNKKATFLQTVPQLRNVSTTIHIHVLMYMHSSETKLTDSLLHCEDRLHKDILSYSFLFPITCQTTWTVQNWNTPHKHQTPKQAFFDYITFLFPHFLWIFSILIYKLWTLKEKKNKKKEVGKFKTNPARS